ncbi:hypothetical protein BJV74DRAFT_737164, partial [Russula compacta]
HFTSDHDHLMAYCHPCERWFPHTRALEQHLEAKHWYCRAHDGILIFNSYAELQSHDRDVHTYCTECKRSFQSQSNLRSHLNSKLHRPTNVRCPGRGCNRAFVSAAALTLHFESGTCPSGMTRKQLDRLVVRVDTNNYITNPDRLLTGPLGQSQPPSTTRMWATDRSWNGGAYECFLCNATFQTLARLNLHLQSPRHEDKIYRCPKSDCRTEFVTLSGLCQHVEGGSCGVNMFRRVQDVMESLTRGF